MGYMYISFVVCVDEWLMFDDENVSMVTSEDILRLSGGGQYLLFASQRHFVFSVLLTGLYF